MSPLVCTLLLAVSTCLAHYRWDYESRNLIERDEPIKINGFELVECPVCESSDSWRYREETCELIENKRYKKCYFGSYKNTACGYRYDCYRGVDEDCMLNDEHDIRCKPGSHCNDLKKCSDGHGQNDKSSALMFIAPNRWQAKRNVISE